MFALQVVTTACNRTLGTYLEPCQIYKMDYFAKIVKGYNLWTILGKLFILDVWQGSNSAAGSLDTVDSQISGRKDD